MKKLPLLLLAVLTIAFISCKKEKSDSSSADIEGTYTFKGTTANTISAISVIGTGEKAVTTTEYTTTDNAGTIVIQSGIMTATDLTYSIDTRAKYEYYVNGVLDDTLSVPFQFTLPAISSASTYKIIGEDSIYFPNSTILSGMDPSTMHGGASGGRFAINGNQLVLKMNLTRDTTFSQDGHTMNQTQTIIANMVMEKQ